MPDPASQTPQPEKLDLRSMDIAEARRRELLRLFPEIRTEGGKLDFERLRLALGEAVDVGRERYGMNWPGKADCFKTIQTPSMGTLRPCPEKSVHWDTTDNLIIEGDNLEVLKLLQKSYLGKIKMIYIDPPYNTGTDFVYPDNFAESLQTYLEYTGQADSEGKRFATNTDADGRFHSKWMNMIFPRLYLARNLLRPDGLLFVSIDDHEVAGMTAMLNELFGEENRVATLVWQKMDSPSRNDPNMKVSDYHEYVLLYAQDAQNNGLFRKPKVEILKGYKTKLPDGRMARARQLRKNGKGARRTDRPTMWFALDAPDGTEVWPIAPEGWEGRWVLSKETWKQREKEGLTKWVKRSYGWVPYYLEIAPTDPGVPWPTLITDADQNRQAVAAFTALMGSEVQFDNPKPVSLMRQLLQMSTSGDDVVLDFFAGSGTTGDAVVRANIEDGGRRRFILTQLPEPTGNGNCPTVADITALRMKRVLEAVEKELADKNKDQRSRANGQEVLLGVTDEENEPESLPPSEEDGNGLGFRVFRLATSNFEEWDSQKASDGSALEDQMQLHVEHIRQGRSADDLLYELLLKTGFALTTPVETLTFAGQKVYSVAGGALMLCLERPLTMEVIRSIADKKPERVVCLDAGFAGNDQLKTNAVQIFKTKGVGSFKTV